MKKGWIVSLVLVMLVSLVAACGGGNENATNNKGNNASNNGAASGSDSGADAGNGEKKELHVFHFKAAIAEEMEEMEKAYEAEHPNVDLTIETVGGGADWLANLKTKFAAGKGPDVFVVEGISQLELWKEYLTDLSDQPWVEHSLPFAKEQMMLDGKLYGMPMNIEGFGFIYNKDLFAQAGIEQAPTTMTELKAAAAKLQDAGILPFSNGFATWWVVGLHMPNAAFAQQDDPAAFVKALNEGTETIAANPKFQEFGELMDFVLENGNPSPLTTDMETQLTLFATGEAAMMHQGNWVEPKLAKMNPDLNLGLLPVPLNDDQSKTDRIQVGIPMNWVVNNQSQNLDGAKEFLNWLAMSETGKAYITDKFKMIPAFDHMDAVDPMGVSQDVIQYSKDDKTLRWVFPTWPDGVANQFADNVQGYIGDQHDFNTMLEKMDQSWEQLKK
ncbi:ABC transporter substrate-binding protein [Marinicrinis sediminis]|uniref:ABC transporter substrate-binding protein n=1 Tax=Marinicrinis sediminis TaxID=1652465 RepID=A0ABW5REY4_9BACL